MLNARRRNPYLAKTESKFRSCPHLPRHLCRWAPYSQCHCPRRLSTKTPWHPLQQSLLELPWQPIATPYAARLLEHTLQLPPQPHAARPRDTLPRPVLQFVILTFNHTSTVAAGRAQQHQRSLTPPQQHPLSPPRASSTTMTQAAAYALPSLRRGDAMLRLV